MELSILIPARNEMFLARTIQDILENIEADTEVIAVLDGEWADPGVPQDDRVNIVYVGKSIGQRAATNLAARLSKAKYLMKVDAHCSFDKGFDRKMIEKMQDDWTLIPIMRNLWAYDWVCECGERKYQDKGIACDKCSKKMKMEMKWIAKKRPQSASYCFDSTPHFQYFREYHKRPEYKKAKEETGLTETMSIQGSCFMCTREKYWSIGLCDERFGSWGNQGIEVACKTWMTGGKVMVNHNTYYAHMFRTKAINDFGFPYPQKGNDVEKTKKRVKNLIWGGKWRKQKYPLSWLVKKFWPVPGWTEEDLKKIS